MSKQRVKKWLWAGVIALVALHIYFVRAMLAAEFLFALLFGILLVVGVVLFLIERASQRSLDWAESLASGLVGFARRGFVRLEEVRRKSFARAGSQPIR